jgi:SAM-dependent methyltransferase
MRNLFDRDYFERGIESGKSCYQNYRWIPELTIPLAMTIIDYLDIKPRQRVLDFGCSKGYLVKAMRWLHRTCYGLDISEYAIKNCDVEVAGYCFKNNGTIVFRNRFDFCIAKDVFEHVPLDALQKFLMSGAAKKYFAVIPLGENGRYRAPANDMDVTHINCMTEEEWMEFFMTVGLNIDVFTFRIKGIKDSYYKEFPTAHGFFTLSHNSITERI